jgi:hypothetical protein
MISIQILVQRFQKWAQGRGTQPLHSKEIKISSNSLIHKVCQRAIKPPMVFIKIQKQVPLFNGPKAEKTSQTSSFQLQIKKGIFQAMLRFGIKKVLLNCQRPHLKPPSRDIAWTVYTAENLFFTSFL